MVGTQAHAFKAKHGKCQSTFIRKMWYGYKFLKFQVEKFHRNSRDESNNGS